MVDSNLIEAQKYYMCCSCLTLINPGEQYLRADLVGSTVHELSGQASAESGNYRMEATCVGCMMPEQLDHIRGVDV